MSLCPISKRNLPVLIGVEMSLFFSIYPQLFQTRKTKEQQKHSEEIPREKQLYFQKYFQYHFPSLLSFFSDNFCVTLVILNCLIDK